MLTINPKNRISTEEAISHPFFSEEPEPNNDDFFEQELNVEIHDFMIVREKNTNNGNNNHNKLLGQKRERDNLIN